MKNRIIGTSLICALACSSNAVLAQTLEEIVVTAQKREQSLQDVPISVQALSGDQMIAQGITRLEDLSESVPNVEINQDATGPAISIRGIRTSSRSASFEQSVGTFSDGAYVGRAWQSMIPFLDVERVEVLRGAQPTFFGQNVIAGAFNITTRGPGEEFEGFINAESGTYLDAVEGAVSIPVSDTFGLRVAGRWAEKDGYVENYGTGNFGKPLGTYDQQAVRVVGEWEASDKLDVRFKVESAAQDQFAAAAEGFVVCNIGIGGCTNDRNLDPSGGELYDFVISTDYTAAPGNGWMADLGENNTTQDAHDTTDSDLLQLTLNYDFGDFTLTSNTLYSEYDNFIFRDLTGWPDSGFESWRKEVFESTASELRLTSNEAAFDGTLDWMAGLYYSDQELQYDTISGGMANQGYEADETTDYKSAFVALTAHLNDSFRVNAGIRYIDVEKDSLQIGIINPYPGPGPFGAQAYTIDNLTVEQMFADYAGNYAPPTVAALAAGACTGMAVNCLEEGLSESDEAWDIGFQWDVNESHMLYAKIYESFKQGAFNLSAASVPAGPGVGAGNRVAPESVDGIEVGIKSDLMDGRARLNISAFTSDYENFQESNFNFAVFAFEAENVGQVAIDGIEFDFMFAASEEITLTLAGALMDATYGPGSTYECNFHEAADPTSGCVAGSIDRDGQEMMGNPDWALNFNMDYLGQLTDSLTLNANFGMSARDGAYTSTSFYDSSFQDAYVLLNARVGIGSVDGTWNLTLYGRNLTDQRVVNVSGPGGNDDSGWDAASLAGTGIAYNPDIQDQFGAGNTVLQPDRELGLQLRYNF